MIRHVISVFLALAIAVGAAGCGKKSDLDPPPGKKDEYPRIYPR